jgi:hypothetical protein
VLKHVDQDTGAKSHAHALNWALSDVEGKRYFQEAVLDPDSPKSACSVPGYLEPDVPTSPLLFFDPAVIQKQLDTGRVIKDPRLLRAYEEVLAKGAVPLPDRMFKKGTDAKVGGSLCVLHTCRVLFEGSLKGSHPEPVTWPLVRVTGSDGSAEPRLRVGSAHERHRWSIRAHLLDAFRSDGRRACVYARESAREAWSERCCERARRGRHVLLLHPALQSHGLLHCGREAEGRAQRPGLVR